MPKGIYQAIKFKGGGLIFGRFNGQGLRPEGHSRWVEDVGIRDCEAQLKIQGARFCDSRYWRMGPKTKIECAPG